MGLKRNNPGCNCCGSTCGGCTALPLQVEVVVPDVIFLAAGCTVSDCDALEGTYVLDYSAALSTGGGICTWIYDFPSAICVYDRLRLGSIVTGGNLTVTLEFNDFTNAFAAFGWQRNYGAVGAANCTAWASESLSTRINLASAKCIGAVGTSALLTAL
jgi:hypothetical protein